MEGCIKNCLLCGKCAKLPILDTFHKKQYQFTPREGYGIAMDIGTTTVVLALADLHTCDITARHCFPNPQRAFGPDVISRINASNEGYGGDLRALIVKQISNGIDELMRSRHIESHRVLDMVIAGNTTMIYLLLGFPCQSLGASPFKPECRLSDQYTAKDLLCHTSIDVPVMILPWLGAFIGGDITAGLLHVLPDELESFILIDLGTNGEITLYNRGRLVITATAAGPAFEDAALSGGASGVIHELALLVRSRALTEAGLLTSDSCFTQKQIRNLQLAKSAVRSGIEILMDIAGIQPHSVDAVYLAGGIGQAMHIDDAVDIGLIPAGLHAKTRSVGNASLGGAVRVLFEPEKTSADIRRLTASMCEVNLAEHPLFNDRFMEYMFFES